MILFLAHFIISESNCQVPWLCELLLLPGEHRGHHGVPQLTLRVSFLLSVSTPDAHAVYPQLHKMCRHSLLFFVFLTFFMVFLLSSYSFCFCLADLCAFLSRNFKTFFICTGNLKTVYHIPIISSSSSSCS